MTVPSDRRQLWLEARQMLASKERTKKPFGDEEAFTAFVRRDVCFSSLKRLGRRLQLQPQIHQLGVRSPTPSRAQRRFFCGAGGLSLCFLQVLEFGTFHQRLELLLFLNGKHMESQLSSLLVQVQLKLDCLAMLRRRAPRLARCFRVRETRVIKGCSGGGFQLW